MDTRIATSAELAVEQTVIFMPSRSAPRLGATSHEIENMRRLMDADTHLTFV
jgi:hypothetical protein